MPEDNDRVDGVSSDDEEKIAGAIVNSSGLDSGELALAEEMFVGGLLGVTSLLVPDIDELLGDPIAAEMAGEINSARGVGVFDVADRFAMEFMLKTVVPMLPAEFQNAAKAVLEYTNFSLVPEGSMAAFQVLSHNKQAVSRTLILYMLDNCGEGEDKGFNAVETAELVHGMKIADNIDEMYIKWERTAHSIPDTKERLERGFKSPWHIVQLRDGQHQEVPYKEIFADQYEAIDSALQALISDLLPFVGQSVVPTPRTPEIDELAALAQSKLNYYVSLRIAFNETDPSGLPALWKQVDRAYVHQGGRFVVSFCPETGYGVNETGAIPEYFLRMRWPEHKASVMADSARTQITDSLPSVLDGRKGALEGVSRIEKAGPPVISYFAVRSGRNLPNDPDVRSKEGVLGTFTPDVMRRRMVEAKELFRKFFGPGGNQLLSFIDDDAVLSDVIVHEMGHNLGTPNHFPDSFERSSLEEWKASALECVLRKLRIDGLKTEELAGAFVADVCQTLRYCQKRASASQALYYGAYKFFMKTAQEVGLLYKSDKGRWLFDFDRKRLVDYMDAVSAQWLRVQDIYDSGSNEDLLAFAKDSVMAATPLIEDMEKVV